MAYSVSANLQGADKISCLKIVGNNLIPACRHVTALVSLASLSSPHTQRFGQVVSLILYEGIASSSFDVLFTFVVTGEVAIAPLDIVVHNLITMINSMR